jgi:hypothetical protein
LEVLVIDHFYISGIFENLMIIAPLLLLVLMPAGFIGSAWVTNTIMDFFITDPDEISPTISVITLVLLSSLFASYCFLLYNLFLSS